MDSVLWRRSLAYDYVRVILALGLLPPFHFYASLLFLTKNPYFPLTLQLFS